MKPTGVLLIGHGATSRPYLDGVEQLAESLRTELKPRCVKIAYNEFCSPTIEEGICAFLAEGILDVVAISTMVIPGGSHSEIDIPLKLDAMRKKHPNMTITYAWPFDLVKMGRFFGDQIRSYKIN